MMRVFSDLSASQENPLAVIRGSSGQFPWNLSAEQQQLLRHLWRWGGTSASG